MDKNENYSISVTEEKRKDKKSRYKSTIPLKLINSAHENNRVDFRGYLVFDGDRYKIKLHTVSSENIKENLQKIISMIDEVLDNSKLRDSYADKFKDYVIMDLFPEDDDSDELLTILSNINLPPPNFVSEKNLEYIKSKFEELLQS